MPSPIGKPCPDAVGCHLLRGLTQNRTSLAADAKDPALRPWQLDCTPSELAQRIRRFAHRQSRWSLASVAQVSPCEDSGTPRDDGLDPVGQAPGSSDSLGAETAADLAAPVAVHLTRKTRLFRFVDDVHLRIFPDGGGSRVEGTSQSRVGKGDLGQNARNLRELFRDLRSSESD